MNSNSDKERTSRIMRSIDREYGWILSVEGAFGRWIVGIWGGYADISAFDDIKEAFFILLERLLRDGKAVLTVPVKMNLHDTKFRVQDNVPIWAIPIDEQVRYIRKTFPDDATQPNDMKITDYFYGDSCPRIGWIHPETGELVMS